MRKTLLILTLLWLYSCAPVRNINYFQDVENGTINTIAEPQTIRVQPDDKISIVVNSRDHQLMQLVNLVDAKVSLNGSNSSREGVTGYTIDPNGNIEFPVLGKIHVAGMTRAEISTLIKARLISEEAVKDPIVTVEFVNLTVAVMGEVATPGMYTIQKDQMTILDALTMAGDMTIYGEREGITVLRESDNKQIAYKVNILDVKSLLESPAYYLTQNDIVYVEPNEMKSRQSTVNGNTVRSTSFWLSLVSFLTTITVLFVK